MYLVANTEHLKMQKLVNIDIFKKQVYLKKKKLTLETT